MDCLIHMSLLLEFELTKIPSSECSVSAYPKHSICAEAAKALDNGTVFKAAVSTKKIKKTIIRQLIPRRERV
jgi:hypothetical protein